MREVYDMAEPTPERSFAVSGAQGVQVGSGNVQYNLFMPGILTRPFVVAGSIPQPSPGFQPREDLMARLRAPDHGGPVVRVLTGMRGVGKTQLAAAYARECVAAGWRLVAWVNAETTVEALAGLAVVADVLGISRAGGTPLETVAAVVRSHLEAYGARCLLVLDNVTDMPALREYLPTFGECRVVITSTSSVMVPGNTLSVGVFSPAESLEFLAERTGRHDPEGAATLADELGHLPLALALAAAMIASQSLTYQAYLDRLRSLTLGDRLRPAQSDPYLRGAAQTVVLLAVDAVAAADESGISVALLDLISVLSPTGIPLPLLYTAGRVGLLRPPAQPGSSDRWRASGNPVPPEKIEETLAQLADASLLWFTTDDALVTAHRLVTRVIRERHVTDGTLAALGTSACTLLTTVHDSLPQPWRDRPAARDFVLQATALYEHLVLHLSDQDSELAADLLRLRGWALSYLLDLGDTAAEAVQIGEPLLVDSVRLLGESHPDTLTSRNDLASAYLAAGRVAEAVSLYERTLADREQVLGQSHPDTLASRNDLASAYLAAGRVAEAVPLYERTLADREQVLGQSHPDTLASRSELASVYLAAGRVAEAVPLYERALADFAQVVGESHPATLASRDNLALAYLAVGRLGEAVPLLETALADRERVLGESHPATLRSRGSLASAYQAAGRLGEAVPLYERALADRERVLGESHPDTLASRNDLASAYLAAGRLGEALPLLEEVLADYVRVLGESHPATLRSRGNLASAYKAAGRLGAAVPLYEQTLADRVRVLGESHPDTLRSRSNLASTYQAAGQAREAVPLLEEVLADYVRVLGESHPDTLASLNNLAFAYQATGRVADAVRTFEAALAGMERVLGADHPDTILVRKNLEFARREARK
jgi:tetratricopeptide (TPR) repeat protein